jgi:alpha-D-ribose 1-methylphosphonate 5-triphosphate synthase subunit PhnG
VKKLPQITGAAAVESRIENQILLVRDQRVILDRDLAEVYGVATKVLNQAVRRNIQRFPEDFMFQLTLEEGREVLQLLRSQIVTLETTTENRGRHPKYAPYVFTELGVSMLSSVLGSEQAILTNISIMRAFVKLRPDYAFGEEQLGQRLRQLEWQQSEQNEQIRAVLETLDQLKEQPPAEADRKRIGFPTSMALLKALATRK